MVAVQKNLVSQVSNLVLRRFDQAHAQIFRRKIDSVEVARNAALGRQDHDGRGVRVLIAGGVVLILKADSLGEGVDRVGRACQEVPAGGGAGTPVALEVVRLFCGGDFGSFFRIEADGDDVEFVADVELDHLHRSGQAGQCLSAKHGAVVIDKIQNQRLLAEVAAEFDGASGIVDEGEIRRNLRVETLLDADVFKIRRTDTGRRGHDALGHGLGHGLSGNHCQQREARREHSAGVAADEGCRAALDWTAEGGCPYMDRNGHRIVLMALQFFFFAAFSSLLWSVLVCERTGIPRWATSSMARSIGMRTVPAFWSIQSYVLSVFSSRRRSSFSSVRSLTSSCGAGKPSFKNFS